jgi:hypothetical protein
MATNFTVEIDWDHDESWTDETSRTRRVQIRTGFEKPWQFVAVGGRCVLTMDNSNQRFSPGNNNGALYGKLLPRRAVRVSATDGIKTWRLFRGFIEAIRPDAGEWGGGECIIECVDGMAILTRQQIGVAHAASKAVDLAVDEVVSAAYTPKSEAYSDNGDTLEHYGRSWKPEETTCLEALEEIAQAVYGRFYIARDGEATFLSRNDLQDSSEVISAMLGNMPYWKRIKYMRLASLVAYWRLNESEGSTAEDSSGNNFDGTVTGTGWGQAGIGDGSTAPLFNGTNAWINVYSTGLRDAFNPSAGTLFAWFRVSGVGVWSDGTTDYMVDFEADSDNRVILRKDSTSNKVFGGYKAGGTTKFVQDTITPDAGWHSLAVTWDTDADQVKVFLDGAQLGSTQTGLGTWAGNLASNGVTIGSLYGTAMYWDGCLAHVALWDVALTPAEIAMLAEV